MEHRAMPTRAVLTYGDYAALPDDGRHYELHRGELSVTPAPGTRHQEAVISLGSKLYEHVRSHGLGKVFVAPTDCILSSVTVVQPDILYVATDRLSMISERGIEGAPTLVVERSGRAVGDAGAGHPPSGSRHLARFEVIRAREVARPRQGLRGADRLYPEQRDGGATGYPLRGHRPAVDDQRAWDRRRADLGGREIGASGR